MLEISLQVGFTGQKGTPHQVIYVTHIKVHSFSKAFSQMDITTVYNLHYYNA